MINLLSCSEAQNDVDVMLAKDNWSEFLKVIKRDRSLIKRYKGFNNESLLHVVSSKGYYDKDIKNVIDFLVKNGADVNGLDLHGRTALHCAAYYGSNSKTYLQLISYGADELIKDKDGKTPKEYKRKK